jgi:hypothetical protein
MTLRICLKIDTFRVSRDSSGGIVITPLSVTGVHLQADTRVLFTVTFIVTQ